MNTTEPLPSPVAFPYEDGRVRLEKEYRRLCEHPSDINEHLPTLRNYAVHCDRVTEFGIRHAVSTVALLYGLAERSKHTGRQAIYNGYDLLVTSDALRVQQSAGFAGVATMVQRADTRTVEIAECDLLFIDTLHTYDQCRLELFNNHRRVRRWIILHDTTTFGVYGEVSGTRGLNYAIADFVKECLTFYVKKEDTNNNGLTILERRGQETPADFASRGAPEAERGPAA